MYNENGQFTIIGPVGIGTPAPSAQLEVKAFGSFASGDIKADNVFVTGFFVGDGSKLTNLSLSQITNFPANSIPGSAIEPQTITADRLKFSIAQPLWSSGSNNAIYYNSGNIGISTQNPNFNLDVNGIVNATQFYRNGSLLNITTSDIADGSITNSKIQAGTITVDRLASSITSTLWSSRSNNAIYYSGGNVGVSTQNPQFNLDVNGTVNATQLYRNGSPLQIATNDIVDASITGSKIQDGSIPGSKIQPGTITADRLNFPISTPSGNNSQWTTSSDGTTISYSNGNVGIGTSNPQQNLSVNGGLNIDQANANNGSSKPGLTFGSGSGEGIASNRSSSGNQNGLDFYTHFTPRISITNGGNVGINTQSPNFNLDVNGTINVTQLYRNGVPLQITANDVADGSIPGSKIQPGTITADRLAVPISWITGSDGKTISYSNGNVGIGTSNPQQNLSVNGGLNIDQANGNNGSNNPGLTFGSLSGEGIASNRKGGTNQYGLDFYTDGLSRISITNGGNIGIGTQSPQALLHLQAPPTPNALGGNAGNIQLFFPSPSAGTAGLDFSYDGGDDQVFGFAHYGATNQGQTIFVWRNNDTDNVLMRIWNTGEVDVSGNLNVAGQIAQASSRELKENITDVSTQEAIASLPSLNPVKFNYRNDLQKETILGFIAEDVPELVATRDRKTVAPLQIIALLTKVVQEQQAQISQLRDRINALEAAA